MRPHPRRRPSHQNRRTENASSLFYSPRLEALEERLTPATTPFYWKLQSASPVVDPDHARTSWNYNRSGVDPVSGSYTDVSTLTISHAPDQAAYSDVYTSASDPTQTTKVSAAYSSAPGIILPGQLFTISTSVQAEIGANSFAGVSLAAYGLTVHGLSGVKLNLFTKNTGQQSVMGSGSASGAASFTAPKTANADFPNPVGVTPNKPVAHLVIFEYFNFLGNGGATAFEYMYDEVFGTPPQLGFAAPPVGAPVGQTLAPVVLSMTNVPAGSIVTMALGEKPDGAVLSGSLTAPVVNGQATFKNLSLNVPGNYTLVASGLGLTATSRQIQIGDQLKFAVQPLKYVLGTNAITVSVEGIAPNGKVDPLLKLSDVELKLLKDGVSSPIQAAAKVTNGVIQYTLSLASTGENLQLTASNSKALTNATSTPFSGVLSIQSVWTGNGTKVAGGNANWGNPLNWDIGQAPQSGAGQSLIFPANAINKAPIDNMPKPANMDRFTVGDITITGSYRISGTQPLAVAGNIALSQGPDAHLAIADVLFTHPTLLTTGTNTRLTLEGTKGISGQTLTVSGAGAIVLNSPVANEVIISGARAILAGKFAGNGKIELSDDSSVLESTQTNAFRGIIDVQKGSLLIGGANPLGTGALDLGASSSVMTIKVAAPASLGNDHLILDGLALTIQPTQALKAGAVTLSVAGALQVNSPSSLKGPSATNPVNLKGPITGSALTLECAATLGGLLSAPLVIKEGGAATLDVKFGGAGGISIQGGLLGSANSLKSYSGSVSMVSGALGLGSATANFGVGSLVLLSGVLRLPVATATLTNANIQIGGLIQISAYGGKTPAPVAGGKLKIAAPITFGSGSEIDPLAGTVVTLSGKLTGSVKVGGKGEIDRPKSFQASDLTDNIFTLLAGAKLKYI